MTNPYDIQDAARTVTPPTVTSARRGIRRPLLWVLLIVSAAANMVASATGVHLLIGIGFGLLTLACITGLGVDHYTHRTR
jgi:hypothetical protein